jgi:rod shape-determining protein MreB
VAVDKQDGPLAEGGVRPGGACRTPANIVSVHPISAGVNSDFDMDDPAAPGDYPAHYLLQPVSNRVIICVPSSITGVEERDLLDGRHRGGRPKGLPAGKRRGHTVGAGLDILRPNGHMVPQISAAAPPRWPWCPWAASWCASPQDGRRFLRRRDHQIHKAEAQCIDRGETAEELKKEHRLRRAASGGLLRTVKGRCLMTGLPREVTVSAEDMLGGVD